MWRITATPGRLTELTKFVTAHAAANALAFVSHANGESCIVLIDPDDIGLPGIPPGLTAGKPASEPLTFVDRYAA